MSVPLVSIGMPAYNSEQTIRSALDCMLAQTLQDFELIVSDNASTDGTWDIVQEYARRDPRVRGIRQPYNTGANTNYSLAFRASRGRFFKWASSSDWCAPEFLAKGVAWLQGHEDAVLVVPRTRFFETRPEEFTDYDGDRAFDQDSPVERFIGVSRSLTLNNAINGVFRSEALRATRLMAHYPSGDIVLVGHLALIGKIGLLDEPLFYRRMDTQSASCLMDPATVQQHYDYPTRTVRELFPNLRLMAGWARVALSAPLPAPQRLRALAGVLRNTYWRMPRMRQDLVDAWRFALRS